MKTLINLLSVFTLLVLVYSCQPKCEPCPEVSTPHPNAVFTVSNTDTISKDTFDVRKARWDSKYLSYMTTAPIHYFSTPLLDFSTILSDTTYTGTRQYMGMAYTRSGTLSPRLMTVGTKTISGIPNQPDFSIIMDYSAACPTDCN